MAEGKTINYNIIDEFDHIFDEKGNTFLSLRKIQWGEKGGVKLDLRKWYNNSDGGETVGKGFSFLTEEGPHELTRILVGNNFGDTKEILDSVKEREDFIPALKASIGGEPETYKDAFSGQDYYDPSEIFGEDEE